MTSLVSCQRSTWTLPNLSWQVTLSNFMAIQGFWSASYMESWPIPATIPPLWVLSLACSLPGLPDAYGAWIPQRHPDRYVRTVPAPGLLATLLHWQLSNPQIALGYDGEHTVMQKMIWVSNLFITSIRSDRMRIAPTRAYYGVDDHGREPSNTLDSLYIHTDRKICSQPPTGDHRTEDDFL